MSVHVAQRDLPSNGNWLSIEDIPRSNSPDTVDPNCNDDDVAQPPELSSSIFTGDTRSSSGSSISTVAASLPPCVAAATPQPIKKSGRLHNMFHHASGQIRAGFRMTPMTPSSEDSVAIEASVAVATSANSTKSGRRSSTASSLHSYGSSVSSTWSRFSLSFKQPSPQQQQRYHQQHQQQALVESPPRVARLAEKYGRYIKPSEQQRTFKGMGATSKKNIGSGATAVIRLVRHNGMVLAVKEFKKRDKSESERDYEKRMKNEYCISKTISGHPNVIETLDLVKDERDRWCAVMEYCAGGDLFNLLQERPNISIVEMACLFKQILLGLQHLHHLGIAHRDIKPENLVLTEGGMVKVADFGTADVVQTCFEADARLSHKWCGSEPFWSPEIWSLKNEHDGYDGRALDVWSAAITYMCIRTHMLPFHAAFYTDCPSKTCPPGAKSGSPADVAARAKDGGDADYRCYFQQRQQLGIHACDVLKDLLEAERECLGNMLDPNPTTRLTVDQALETPWLKSVELCNEGILPNGWRHYHCRPSSTKIK